MQRKQPFGVLVRVTTAGIKHHGQNQLGEKRPYLALLFTTTLEGSHDRNSIKQDRNLEAGPEAAMEEC